MVVLFPGVISRYSVTSLVAQNFHQLGPRMLQEFQSTSTLSWTGLGQREVFLYFLCACFDRKTTFIQPETLAEVSLARIQSLFFQMCHSYHMGLDNFFMPELINFCGQFFSLACILPPWGTSPVTDKWDGDLWKCWWGDSSQSHQTACGRGQEFLHLLGCVWGFPEGSAFSRHRGNCFSWWCGGFSPAVN